MSQDEKPQAPALPHDPDAYAPESRRDEATPAETMLRDLVVFIKRCARLLEDNNSVDVTGLDTQVKKLCEQINGMDLAEAEKLNPRLTTLMEALNELGAALEEKRDEVRDQLGNIGSSQKASTAYSKAAFGPSSDGDKS